MTQYITFRDVDSNNELCYFILLRKWPYYIGKVIPYYQPDAIAIANVPAHSLWVVYDGVIEGRYFPSNGAMKDELKEVFQKMAEWYYANRILTNPKKFKKWALS